MGALIAIARALLAGTVGGAGFAAGTQLAEALTPGGRTLQESVLGLRPRGRARRRKMFTNTDIAQFAAAEAIGGKKAAVSLMMIRAARA